MIFEQLHQIIFNQNKPISEVISCFNETAVFTDGKGFGIVINADGIAIGVITDGDIRRKLMEGVRLEEPVSNAMKQDFIYAKTDYTTHQILRLFDDKIPYRIVNVPLVDEKCRPVDLYRYSSFLAQAHTQPRIIRARVPVRVSFSGGGTDMSRYINKTPTAVLSSTINKYCTASVIIRNDDEVHISSKDLNLKYTAKNFNEIEYGDDLDLIKAAVNIMQPEYGFNLETFAEFEPGTGLGGSSALVVSVLGALNFFRNEQQLDIYQISDLAYQVERIDMNIYGGWQDQYATAFGGFSWIDFRQNEVVVNSLNLHKDTLLELEYNLMLFRLGGNRSSSRIQEKYMRDIDSNNKNLKSFKMMIALAVNMKDALLKGDIKKFADLLHESWNYKRKMNKGVTNDFVEDCYNTARDLGALGGKLLGAGGSGYLLIYASPLYQKRIKEVLAEKGVIQEFFRFSSKGLEVWSTKK